MTQQSPDAARDEAAENYSLHFWGGSVVDGGDNIAQGFKAGWNACAEHDQKPRSTERVEEFPEAEFKKEFEYGAIDQNIVDAILDGARWGWDRGRESLNNYIGDLKRIIAGQDFKVDELEEKLARAAQLMGTRDWSDFERGEKRVKELEENLAAAESRRHELLDSANRWAARASEAEKRIAELEAKLAAAEEDIKKSRAGIALSSSIRAELEAKLAEAVKVAQFASGDGWNELPIARLHIAELEAENARMRSALEFISAPVTDDDGSVSDTETMHTYETIAREALEPRNEGVKG